MGKYELRKKLSVKEVCGDVKKKIPEGKATNWLMEIIGIATGFKTGTSTFGDFVAFTGTFKAVDMDGGQEYRAGKLFLPGILQEMLMPAVQNPDSKGVEFAFRIGIKRDETVAVGYTYTAEPLIPVSENDPIELLGSKLKAQLALAAPEKEAPKAIAGGKK